MDIELYKAFEKEIGQLKADIIYKEVLILKLQKRILELEPKEGEDNGNS